MRKKQDEIQTRISSSDTSIRDNKDSWLKLAAQIEELQRPYDLTCYGNTDYICTESRYIKRYSMETTSVNKFRKNLKTLVEQVVNRHEPLKVTRRAGEDFIVVSADDWEREQESLYVLQNSDLMQQIAHSLKTHTNGTGHQPTGDELNEITGI